MRRSMSNGPKRVEQKKKKPKATAGEVEAKEDDFPEPDGCV